MTQTVKSAFVAQMLKGSLRVLSSVLASLHNCILLHSWDHQTQLPSNPQGPLALGPDHSSIAQPYYR
jgi:hypothetical protein